jgi:hypothetical protein
MGHKRKAHRVLVEKPEGKIPLGRNSHRRKDNIKVGFKEDGTAWLRIRISGG